MRLVLSMILFLQVVMTAVAANYGGIPFITNFSTKEYNAHNRNFDIVSDDYGRVIVANFEGLLYYDQTEWNVLHSPGVNRMTRLYKDQSGVIWVGGNNFFGRLSANRANGSLELDLFLYENNHGFLGEVTDIFEEDGKVIVVTPVGNEYLKDYDSDLFEVRKKDDYKVEYYRNATVNKKITLDDGTCLLATTGLGLVVLDRNGEEKYCLSRHNGLCDNNVNSIYVNDMGIIWGATDNGLFLLDMHNAYTQFSETEGLEGEVQSIFQTSHGLYVGTLQGLFIRNNDDFERIEPIHSACWHLTTDDHSTLYAATAEGLYKVDSRKATLLSSKHTISSYICEDGRCLVGGVDGFYVMQENSLMMVNDIEKAVKIYEDSNHAIWVQNIFGQIFRLGNDLKQYEIVMPEFGEGQKAELHNILYKHNDNIIILNNHGRFVWDDKAMKLKVKAYNSQENLLHSFPKFVYVDPNDRLWSTDNSGKNLFVTNSSGEDSLMNVRLHPIHELNIMSLIASGNDIWMGGNFGLIHFNTEVKEPAFSRKSDIFIRSIVVNDSVVWGGYNLEQKFMPVMKNSDFRFAYNMRNIEIRYSSDIFNAVGNTEYRYALNGKWSEWSTETSAHLINLMSGDYTFEVMGKDRFGRETEPVGFDFYIQYPVYLRWYSIVFYILVLCGLIVLFIKWRMQRLYKEKLRLEQIVEERTAMLQQQKAEIEEKSRNLEIALDDLGKAQYQLVRQEKMATVGTLTQGLVDRILNPMNYVNNFSHMCVTLIKELKENIEDEKDAISEDGYDDSMDVIDMMGTNLSKIEEHGASTVRILKAMEEMLKDRSPQFSIWDVASICRKNIEIVRSYFAKEIDQYHIEIQEPAQEEVFAAEIDAEQIKRVILSILNNSFYAVKKKYSHQAYKPLISMSIDGDDKKENVVIKIRDNGIGIEKGIIEKIFDPFFTTKTTAEAAGIGMYLSREIILNHNGNITADSVKDEYTEICIKLPFKQPE